MKTLLYRIAIVSVFDAMLFNIGSVWLKEDIMLLRYKCINFMLKKRKVFRLLKIVKESPTCLCW